MSSDLFKWFFPGPIAQAGARGRAGNLAAHDDAILSHQHFLMSNFMSGIGLAKFETTSIEVSRPQHSPGR